MIYNSIVDLVGNTPLVRLHMVEDAIHTDCEIYAKLEKQNPAGSIKDRVALNMLLDYKKKGLLNKDAIIIEPTSGNTGIALSAFGNYFKNKVIIIMPSSMSEQRKELMKDYNAELILVDGGMDKCVEKANEIHANTKNSLIAGQFNNPSNVEAHFLHTGPEIHKDIADLDYVFAGIGTGGTISGIGKYFKANNLKTNIIGIEPASSPLITEGHAGKHKIQGIGANFVPDNYKAEYVDKVITVKDDDAIYWAKAITKLEGLLVGISSGASLCGAVQSIENNKLHHKKIVVIFPDTGERYSWN